MVHKRKSRPAADEPARKKGKQIEWPEYFVDLFKTFKVSHGVEDFKLQTPQQTPQAINTVLAFVTNRKQLATSFSSIRSSVENVLKHPLDIEKVAEIKALLPTLVNFSYIPAAELQEPESGKKSYDYSQASGLKLSNIGEVLVLEFQDITKRNQSAASSSSSLAAPTISPAALKKLIEVRNARFEEAVNELILAAPPGEDPVALLVTAGKNHVPIQHVLQHEEKEYVPFTHERPSIEQVLLDIKEEEWYADQIVHRRSIDAKSPEYGVLDPPPSLPISDAISQSRNINQLYSHQAAAIEAFRHGKHVVVSTNTASGKSVIYQIPILSCLEEDPDAVIFLVFPTKALAQDQKASLETIVSSCQGLAHLKVSTYDGDTPKEQRASIRETTSIFLTNFDTLHASILPNEENWRGVFKRLKIMVVDELHYYTGLLGSHVAQIVRRLRRVCAVVGNDSTRFISCSATLANPGEYMCTMFCLDPKDVQVVSADGSPSGSKEYIIWDPPYVDIMAPQLGKRSSISEASMLMRYLMKRGIRVILFCKIRKVCELVYKTLKSDLSNDGRLDILDRVRSYRGGYTRKDRRKIEQDAFAGHLLGIVATNALELGIDIGVLDAVLMLGFPYTLSNFKQQAGRAGRRAKDSLAVLITEAFPIDQYYVQHPTALFDSKLDDLTIDTDNEVVREAHLQCAAFEIPLSKDDEAWFGPGTVEICEKRLRKDADGWYHPNPDLLPYPSQNVAIRGAQEELYMVVDVRKGENGTSSSVMLEEVEFSRALFELYEGGVFMHQGVSYIVEEIQHESRIARMVRRDVDYMTSPRDTTRIEPLQTFDQKFINNLPVSYGRVNVLVKVFGFFKLRHGKILDAVEVATPPWTRESTGFWIDVPDYLLQVLREREIDAAAAIHAAEHGFLNQFQLSDVKTDCRVAKDDYSSDESKAKRPPMLMFYDSAGKTGGISSRAFDHVQGIFEQAQDVVARCQCENGCRACVQTVACKDANLISSKAGAKIILAGILGLPIPEPAPVVALKESTVSPIP